MRNSRWPIVFVAILATSAAAVGVGATYLTSAQTGPSRVIVPMIASDEAKAAVTPSASPASTTTPNPTATPKPSVSPSPGSTSSPTATATQTPSATPSPVSNRLVVRNVSWMIDEFGYPQVRGEVANGLATSVFNVEVTVNLYSAAGVFIATDAGLVDLAEIPAGGVSAFSIAVFDKPTGIDHVTAEVTDFTTVP